MTEKGLAALARNNNDTAVENFTDAIGLGDEKDDDYYLLHYNRAEAYLKAEKFKEAVEDLEKVVKLKPDWIKGISKLGVARFGNKDFIGARRCYERGLDLEPDNEHFKDALEYCIMSCVRTGIMYQNYDTFLLHQFLCLPFTWDEYVRLVHRYFCWWDNKQEV